MLTDTNKSWIPYICGGVVLILVLSFFIYVSRPDCDAANSILLESEKSMHENAAMSNQSALEKRAVEAEKKAKKLEDELKGIEAKITELEILSGQGETANYEADDPDVATMTARGGAYLSVIKEGCQTEAWKFTKADRLKYVNEGHTVPGWMQHPIPYLTMVLAQHQKKIGICGDIGEIGVHRGLFGIAIAHTLGLSEKYLAADIYDLDIGINTAGDLFRENTVQAFTTNLHNFGITPADYVVVRADSTKLRPTDLLNDTIGPYRFFSIDGGHAAEVLFSDMTLVSQIMVNGGIVAMDDWDAPGWDGIRAGFINYYNQFTARDLPLRPLFYSANKMFVTTPSHHQIYTEFIQNHEVLKTLVQGPGVEGPWKYLKIGNSEAVKTKWIELITSVSSS